MLRITVLMMLCLVSCLSSSESDSNKSQDPVFDFENAAPEFVTFLNPVDTNTPTDNSGNVIQGIAAYEDKWFVSQDAGNGYILFNLLDAAGGSVYNRQVSVDSHGQDLSWLQSGQDILLFSGSPDGVGAGISEFTISLSQDSAVFSQHYIIPDLSGFGKSTPTLSVDKNYFVIRASEIVNSENDRVFIYPVASILGETYGGVEEFPLNAAQTVSEQWFQGIAMADEKIYALTGNSSLNTDKILMVYSIEGDVLHTKTIVAGKDVAPSEGTKWEPEGLSIKGNFLYFTINTGVDGNNIKRLYRLQIK